MQDTNKIVGPKQLINLWNYSISAGSTGILGMNSACIYQEAGRIAMERLKEEGISLIKETPLETINSIYEYFIAHGYFEDALARQLQETDTYEFYEKESGERGSPYCLCYNIFRYALSSGFGLEIRLLGSRENKETKENNLQVSFVPLAPETLKAADMMGELRKGQVDLNHVVDALVRINSELVESINEKENSEERLSEPEKRYRALTDTAADAIICLKSPDTIYLWNKKAEDMFGYSADEAINKPLHQLIVPQIYREKAYEGFSEFYRTGRGTVIGKTIELTALRKDGSVLPVELSVSASNIRGKWHATGIIRDISMRKKLENELVGKLDEIERFNKLMVGREIKMGEMKQEINVLKQRLKELEDKAGRA